MSAPSVVLFYPTDGDTGIPIGTTLLVYFDRGVDLQTVKDSMVLVGRDFDQTSGPDLAQWIDDDTGSNPYFLTSPGFSGVVPLNIELVYYTLGTETEIDPGVITSETDEVSVGVGHLAKITVDPNFAASLAPDTEFTFYVNGDPDDTDTGVGSRTVFDVEAGGANAGSGSTSFYGTWSGSTGSDVVHIEITAAGNIGTAEYKWWYTSAGSSTAITGRVTSRRRRSLADGLEVRFSGSDFQVGDSFTVNVEQLERMASSYRISFTTNDGSYSAAPDSPSTPASSSPPASVLPSIDTLLEVIGMTPRHTSYNVSADRREIVIEFSSELDESTITAESVKLWRYPVTGHYDGSSEPAELQKTMTVSGTTLTIRF